jgi:hypothetical protein
VCGRENVCLLERGSISERVCVVLEREREREREFVY